MEEMEDMAEVGVVDGLIELELEELELKELKGEDLQFVTVELEGNVFCCSAVIDSTIALISIGVPSS